MCPPTTLPCVGGDQLHLCVDTACTSSVPFDKSVLNTPPWDVANSCTDLTWCAACFFCFDSWFHNYTWFVVITLLRAHLCAAGPAACSA